MIYYNLILIAIVCVLIIDISGFIEELEHILSKWLKIQAHIPKPFSCSLCSTHWLGLIYLILTNNLNLLNYAILLLIAVNTDMIQSIFYFVKNIILYIIDKLNGIFTN